MEPAISNLLRPVFTAWGMPAGLVSPLAVVIAIAIATILSMILGELVPKNFALAIPRQTAKLVMPFQVGFTTVFRPAVTVLNGSANGVLRAIGIEPKEELSGARTAEELSSLVRRSASAGVLEEDTASLLDRSLTFARLTAADVMTPRPSIHALAAGDSAEDVIQLARRTGHSRFPVYDDSMDDITGIVHLKAAVSVPRDRRADVPGRGARDRAAARSRGGAPRRARVGAAGPRLPDGRSSSTSTAAPPASSRSRISSRRSSARCSTSTTAVAPASSAADGAVIFPGELRPDEVLDRTGIRIPEDDVYDTVGGYIMSVLERIPVVGDAVEIEDGSHRGAAHGRPSRGPREIHPGADARRRLRCGRGG